LRRCREREIEVTQGSSAGEGSARATLDRAGLVATLGAFVIWGLSPLFWKLLVEVPALVLLAHRIIWAAVMLAVFLATRRRLREIGTALSSPAVFLTLTATTILISANWLTYIWAVVTDRVLHASLGYYMNPLVTILLAMAVLRERLDRAQWLSIALAACGVGVLVWVRGFVPWIALVLAVTFGLYSLLRKQVRAEPEAGLLVETGLVAPLALLYLLQSTSQERWTHAGPEPGLVVLLVASGLVTALPLALFTWGARRLRLSTVGFLQFLAPTLQFLSAVFLFDEPFGHAEIIAFGFIWTALAVFTVDLGRHRRRSAHVG
jgi:chloramphenicol-sensitive protein RarD